MYAKPTAGIINIMLTAMAVNVMRIEHEALALLMLIDNFEDRMLPFIKHAIKKKI